MATHNVNDARSSVIGHSAIPNADGSITVVISRARQSRGRMSLTTLGAAIREGQSAAALPQRWFLADGVPVRPDVQLVKVADAPTNVD